MNAVLAKAFIWLFFLLIFDPVLVLMGLKFGLPVKPVGFYAIFAVGLFGAALAIERNVSPFKDAKLFFVFFAALAAIGLVMYRGEGIGPDFGGKLLPDFQTPSSLGYALWPVLNLIAGAGLYLLARREEYRRAIIDAAFVALVLQTVTMEADMWWPALFGDANGRAGGIAVNANSAAMLVVVLTSLTLPARLGDRLSSYAPYAVSLMIVAVLFSQSRAGGIAVAGCLFCFAAATWKGKARWPSLVFTVALLAVFGGTAWLSPVLHPTAKQIEVREEGRAALDAAHEKAGELPTSALELPLTLQERVEARASVDESGGLRRQALTFFLGISKDNPFGIGTGFTNKFQTGPHNTFLKLAVDEGILAAICFVLMLGSVTWQAIRVRSPALLSICITAWLASMLYHTTMVEPLIPVALAIGLGAIKRRDDAPSRT